VFVSGSTFCRGFQGLRTGDRNRYFRIPNRDVNINTQYSSPNIVRMIKSKRMRRAGHVESMEEGRGVYSFLVGKPEGKRPLERTRSRCEDNIKIDLQEVGWGGAKTGLIWLMIRTGVGQFVNMVANHRVP